MAFDTTVNEKFLDGDHLTNRELSHLRRNYERLLGTMQGLGDEFKLMRTECYHRLNRIDSYIQARSERH